MDSSVIYKYFHHLSEAQIEQFEKLGALYMDWNAKINVISRKDIEKLYENHVLHSLAIAKFLGELTLGTSFLDVGTGGGFPGIPLAIYYPECTFHLIDRIGKKIRVASEIASEIGLKNVTFQHGDVGECHDRFNYVVSRAVMPLGGLWQLVRRNILSESKNAINPIPNGLICLKGGDLKTELKECKTKVESYPVTQFLPEPHFEDKSIIYAYQ